MYCQDCRNIMSACECGDNDTDEVFPREPACCTPDFIAGMREAQDIVWQKYKSDKKEFAACYDAHELIRNKANEIESV